MRVWRNGESLTRLSHMHEPRCCGHVYQKSRRGARNFQLTSFSGRWIIGMVVPSLISITLFLRKMAETKRSQKSFSSTTGAARVLITRKLQRVKLRPSCIDDWTVPIILSWRLLASQISGTDAHKTCCRNDTWWKSTRMRFGLDTESKTVRKRCDEKGERPTAAYTF